MIRVGCWARAGSSNAAMVKVKAKARGQLAAPARGDAGAAKIGGPFTRDWWGVVLGARSFQSECRSQKERG